MTAERTRRALGLVLFVCFGIGVAIYLLDRVGTTIVPGGSKYTFEADVHSSIALASAADVREAGVAIGRVTGIKQAGTITALELSIDKKYAPVYRDATILIRAKSVAGENYVSLDPGNPRAGQLPAGGVLSTAHELQPVQDDDVFSIFGLTQRRHLQRALDGLGNGLSGAGGHNLNQAHGGMSAIVNQGQGFARILSDERTQTARLIASFDTVASALGQRAAAIATLTHATLTTSRAVATRDAALRATIGVLPAFLHQGRITAERLGSFSTNATPVMSNLRIAADALVPAIRDLRPAASAATLTLAALDRFATAARPTFTALPAFDRATSSFVAPYSSFLQQLNPFVAYLHPYWREVSNWFANDGAAVSAADPVSNLARVTLPISRSNYPTIVQGSLAQLLAKLSGGFDTRGTNAHPLPGNSAKPQPSTGAVPPLQPDPPYTKHSR